MEEGDGLDFSKKKLPPFVKFITFLVKIFDENLFSDHLIIRSQESIYSILIVPFTPDF